MDRALMHFLPQLLLAQLFIVQCESSLQTPGSPQMSVFIIQLNNQLCKSF